MGYSPPAPSNYPRGYAPVDRSTATFDGLAIASLVLGILGILSSCIICVSLPLGAIGLVLGGFGLQGSNRGVALAGLITSGIAVIATLVLTFLIFARS